ncbi:Hypothetical protein A7982_02164 [Minicystis rosea]|nr:Hypothetical protein A7982_02164 [Minicystis rosea]
MEVIDVSYDGGQHLGLALAYDDPADLELWNALSLSNVELELEDAIET